MKSQIYDKEVYKLDIGANKIPTLIKSVDVNVNIVNHWKDRESYFSPQDRLERIEFVKKCVEQTKYIEKSKMGDLIRGEDVFHDVKIINNSPNQGIVLSNSLYGNVYRAILTPSNCSQIPILLKIQSFYESEGLIKTIANSRQCIQIVNSLIYSPEQVANTEFLFTIDQWIVRQWDSLQSPVLTVYTLMEYADGNLAQLLSTALNPKAVFNFYFQIVFALVVLALETEMTHEELYLQHILFTFTPFHIRKSRVSISEQDLVYELEPINVNIKLFDMGLCSKFLTTKGNLIFSHFHQLGQHHVKDFSNLNKYSKDILSITWQFYQYSLGDKSYFYLQNYFLQVLLYFKEMNHSHYMENAEDLKNFSSFIFSQSFMGKQNQIHLGLTETKL